MGSDGQLILLGNGFRLLVCPLSVSIKTRDGELYICHFAKSKYAELKFILTLVLDHGVHDTL